MSCLYYCKAVGGKQMLRSVITCQDGHSGVIVGGILTCAHQHNYVMHVHLSYLGGEIINRTMPQ